LGTTHTTILRYERGDMKLPRNVLEELARLYQCKPTELQFDPADRKRGQLLHEAMELVQGMDPDIAQRWLEIGKLLQESK